MEVAAVLLAWFKFVGFTNQFFKFLRFHLHFTVASMSSVGSFTDFIQARDAAGLKVFMTNEHLQLADHLKRNNRALFEACRDGAEEICEVLIDGFLFFLELM